MSKITFRADDDLVRQLEEFDASKSEVMREALRAYLEGGAASGPAGGDERADRSGPSAEASVDELLAERVDELVESRLEARSRRHGAQDVNVNITLEGVSGQVSTDAAESGTAEDALQEEPDADEAAATGVAEEGPDDCQQCGEELSPSSVYCPNCGEKANHRSFCECGDEIRSDWAFCPSCGRRTPAANVLRDT